MMSVAVTPRVEPDGAELTELLEALEALELAKAVGLLELVEPLDLLELLEHAAATRVRPATTTRIPRRVIPFTEVPLVVVGSAAALVWAPGPLNSVVGGSVAEFG